MELYDLTIHELRDLLRKEEVSPEEVLDSFYKRIDEVEDKVKAYVTLTRDEARNSLASLKDGRLAGIPLAIKDNISTRGIKTTCSSKILNNYKPPYDATVVKRLKEEGGITLGKTNMDEFAMGSSTENSGFYPTHNPWNLDHAPGGSSGGSAAAVAAGEAPGALGSDTGGSIRQPAAFCGVVGLKPTYGCVSRYGLVAFASSLDQIGPITKDVTDSALLLNVISGHDPMDSTSVDREKEDYTTYLKDDVKGMKIGLPEEYFSLDFNSEVKDKVMSAVKELEKAGAIVEEVSLPNIEYALAAYYIIAPAEASSNLARYDGVRYGYRSENGDSVRSMFTNTRSEGFGDEVKRRIMLGTYVLSSGYYDAFYLKAQKVRTLIKEDFERVFKDYDVLISPTTPTTAFKLGEMTDPLEMYQSDVFTVPVNIAGIPAISVPCGFDSNNLPIGLQIMGPHFGEGKILQTAYTLEQALNMKTKRPKL
ncbi:Asp-tRNA(Asn)/Glu-tRNA(Gln) amidotransferase subunit GatA [Halothermothrix orenii]|uniref:Glutamyl-tRNA(Gln) amidotransferase subunit A n=1 Tax=Halothermothrix orenii (strain H 168 / OCM 544 / DSM 9562) TaxID=373903 RepID=GATA_HALOH|nr:Asp-tRNA(Asn)/Glu-tRNA(Gln) amidotransferase subunit GatA [Halothermothrix orenii]B8D125.1 RecName: Full=Glutamyl-tRNA(Gln) amidotransferase subunit A; Short=Glu-ADT subunit A [Halothermothrix orenii H 168]ACL68994.1 glutamyl-tRNA(Gln) amidotransferase, A subunit [Halothermothrix orenii H 168]